MERYQSVPIVNSDHMGILPTQFEFLPGEITVRSIFRHLKTHEVTGEIVEDWFVVIPQLLSLSINYKSTLRTAIQRKERESVSVSSRCA